MNLKKIFLNLIIMNRNFGKKVVHVESPHIFGEKLKKHLDKYHSKCYCICPANYEYVSSSFGIQMSRKKFYDFLKKYYLELKDKKINLQPHVHLSITPNTLPFKVKEKMMLSAYDFFVKELKIIPKEIVFGWYVSDKDSRAIAKKLNLKIVNEHLHVYDWWLK